MSSRPRTDSWWEPTWRRLVGTTVVLFLVILAFLVGRVRAGADPGLARETTRPAQVAPGTAAPPSAGADPSDPTDPFAPGSSDPGTDQNGSGSDDNFGNAVPDQGTAPDDGSGSGIDPGGGSGQGFDPPSTHVS